MTAPVLRWILCCYLLQCRLAAGMPLSPVDALSDEDLPQGGQVVPAVDSQEHRGQLEVAEPEPRQSKKRRSSKQWSAGDLVLLQHGLRRAVQSKCACKMSTCRIAFRDPVRFEELVKFRLRLRDMRKMDVDKEVHLGWQFVFWSEQGFVIIRQLRAKNQRTNDSVIIWEGFKIEVPQFTLKDLKKRRCWASI